MTASAPTTNPNAGDISALWAWLSIGALFAILIVLVFVNPALLRGELGVVEQLQNLFLFVALLLSIDVARRADGRLMLMWMGLVILGTIYLLGEETSWGQHYFGWGVGEGVFSDINDQGETNFHNSTSWLDQKPRAILLFGMILGAVIHPLVKWARKGRGLFDNPWWLAPTLASLPPVVFSQLAALPKKIDKLHMFAYSLNLTRWSEMEEVFMYIFFVTYTLSLRQRLIHRKRAGAS